MVIMSALKLEEFTPQQSPLRVQVADFLRDSILTGNQKPGFVRNGDMNARSFFAARKTP
jgi:hypothetical protein